MSHKRTTVLVS